MKKIPPRYLVLSAGILALLLIAAVSFLLKDRVIFWAFQRYLRGACPGCEVYVKGLDVGWRQARADALVFKLSAGTPPQAWSGSFSDLRVAYDPGRLFARSLDGLLEGWVAVDRVSGPGFLLEKGEAGIGRKSGVKDLMVAGRCARISVSKKEISEVSGRAFLREGGFTVTGLQGVFAGGLASVTGEAAFAPSSRIEGVVDVIGLDVTELIRIFDLGDRVEATGVFAGRFSFAFDGAGLRALSGSLVNKAGGRLHVIQAPALPGVVFEQATNIVVESLKNYYYDRGEVSVGLEERNVKIDFMLEGLAGKRDLTFVWHPFEDIAD